MHPRALLEQYFSAIAPHEPSRDLAILLGRSKQIALCHLFAEVTVENGITRDCVWGRFTEFWAHLQGDSSLLPIIERVFYAEPSDETYQKITKKEGEYYDWTQLWALANFLGDIVEDYAMSSITLRDNAPILNWMLLPKKRHGVYFTPPDLARYIAGRIRCLWDESWAETRIFDPSVGSGYFLLAFAEIYANSAKGLEQQDFQQFLTRNLFGVDRDPAAVTATALILGAASGVWSLIPNIAQNLRQSDALQINDREQYHIVVGNPPWGSITGIQRKYYAKKYPMCNDYENFEYFSVLGLDAVIPGGIHAFIVPNTFFRNTMSAKFREWYARRASFVEIHDFSASTVFFAPKVRSSVFIARRGTSQDVTSNIMIHTGKVSENNITTHTIPPGWFQGHISEWHLSLVPPAAMQGIYYPILQISHPLSNYTDTKQGFIPYRTTTLAARLKSRLKDFIENRDANLETSTNILEGVWPAHVPNPTMPVPTRENYEEISQDLARRIVRDKLWQKEGDVNIPVPKGYIPLLKGRDVRPFSIHWGGMSFAYGPHVSSFVETHFFTHPRLLFPEITGPRPYLVQAAYTPNPFVHDPQVLNAVFKENIPEWWHWFCLAAVNSLPVSAFMAITAPKAGKGLFDKLLIRDIKRIPIPYDPRVLGKEMQSSKDSGTSVNMKSIKTLIQDITIPPPTAIELAIHLGKELTRIQSEKSSNMEEIEAMKRLRELNDQLFCRIFGVDYTLCLKATQRE